MAKQKAAAAPDNENKSERFVRLAKQRVNMALARIAQIGQLATKANYEYSDGQVGAIKGALQDALDKVSDQFRNGKATGGGFDF